jgi:hypothetical protein
MVPRVRLADRDDFIERDFRMASATTKKGSADNSRFKQLAPRMMRDLMRDFAPLAEFQAAGAVGNGGEESGGFNKVQEEHPTVEGSKGGLGFFQWTGMGTVAKPKRRRIFEGLLKEMDRNADSYDANYEMLKTELKGAFRSTVTKLRSTQTIEAATESFMKTYEGPAPATAHLDVRLKFAKIALAAFQAEEEKIAKNPPSIA